MKDAITITLLLTGGLIGYIIADILLSIFSLEEYDDEDET